jgi:Domain of unknown function (DUF4388)
MAKARDTATDRLSNVIEVVELGRRTGLLSAERGSGSFVEEAEIYFVGGRAIYAATSNTMGRDALADLGQWGACRFCFDTTAPRPAPNLAATFESQPSIPTGGSWPTPSSVPATPGVARGARTGWNTPGSQPAFGPAPASVPPARSSQPAWPGSGADSGAWGASQPGTSAPTGPLARRPRRVHDVRDLMGVVSSNNLSRSHRALLLLADGSHNVLDLARLASKSVDDVTQLLAELEGRGLIYYYE